MLETEEKRNGSVAAFWVLPSGANDSESCQLHTDVERPTSESVYASREPP